MDRLKGTETRIKTMFNGLDNEDDEDQPINMVRAAAAPDPACTHTMWTRQQAAADHDGPGGD